ncbi:hypothetical protein PM082_006715 [Marasmius tenuissimus]|nr:hypothetical protein PM082_006715 [Marasmius tenuissimus]
MSDAHKADSFPSSESLIILTIHLKRFALLASLLPAALAGVIHRTDTSGGDGKFGVDATKSANKDGSLGGDVFGGGDLLGGLLGGDLPGGLLGGDLVGGLLGPEGELGTLLVGGKQENNKDIYLETFICHHGRLTVDSPHVGSLAPRKTQAGDFLGIDPL